jgi:hypothetical protein
MLVCSVRGKAVGTTSRIRYDYLAILSNTSITPTIYMIYDPSSRINTLRTVTPEEKQSNTTCRQTYRYRQSFNYEESLLVSNIQILHRYATDFTAPA